MSEHTAAQIELARIERVSQARTRLNKAAPELLEAGQLKRNVIFNGENVPGFVGDWIAIPREDFDTLRAAIALASPQESEAGT